MPDRPFVSLDHGGVAPVGYEFDDDPNHTPPPTDPGQDEDEDPLVWYVLDRRQPTRESATALRDLGLVQELHAETGTSEIDKHGHLTKIGVEGSGAVIEKNPLEPRSRQGVVQFGCYRSGQNRVPSYRHRRKIAENRGCAWPFGGASASFWRRQSADDKTERGPNMNPIVKAVEGVQRCPGR